jgi:hypothetical protein
MSILNIRDASCSLQMMAQPDASIPGSEIAFTNGVYYPVHEGVRCNCRAAELLPTGTDGNLEVHLVKDPAGRWYIMPLNAGVEKGRYFDAIRSTNTTVTLSQLTLFPTA